jgi:hypothetical protein
MNEETAIESTAAEKSTALRRDARAASAADGAKHMAKAFHATGNIAELQVVAINAMRAAGVCFNVASGREQLLFNPDGFKFAREYILPHLPAGAKLEHVQFAVHMANILPAPVKSAEELRSYKREIQLVMSLCGIADEPRRIGPQTSHEKNHFVEVIVKVRTLDALFEKLEEEEPLNKWADDKLAEILRDTKPARGWLEKLETLAASRGVAI